MSETPLPWDDFQRDVLDALGHVVYRTRSDRAEARVPATPPEDAGAPPLLRAIARAANTRIERLPDLPALDTLRAPAAKRALWPTLRALRKAART